MNSNYQNETKFKILSILNKCGNSGLPVEQIYDQFKNDSHDVEESKILTELYEMIDSGEVMIVVKFEEVLYTLYDSQRI